MEYTEYTIYSALKRHFNHIYQLRGCYVFNWESDYFGMTRAGYCIEVEIKISVSDFNADSKKIDKHRSFQFPSSWYRTGWTSPQKEGSRYCSTVGKTTWQGPSTAVDFKKSFTPNRFYYCVPWEIADKIEVPSYAGLLIADIQPGWSGGFKMKINQQRPAPLLHKQKHEMNRILLDKFYYLSERLTQRNEELFKESNQTQILT